MLWNSLVNCQESKRNIGVILEKSYSSGYLGSNIGVSGFFKMHQIDCGIILTNDSERSFPPGLNGIFLGYRVYPRTQKVFNLYFYLDNNFISAKSSFIPTSDGSSTGQLPNGEYSKVNILETLIGYGFDITMIKRIKFFTDMGVGKIFSYYKFDEKSDYPRKMKNNTVQFKIGISVFLNKF